MVTTAPQLVMGMSWQHLTHRLLIPGRSFLAIILPVTILATFHLLRYVFSIGSFSLFRLIQAYQ